MADSKITALTAISTVDPTADPLVIVDVSDTSMAASGTTKKITSNQILGAGGTATLASATITGDLTVKTNVLKVDTTNNRVGVGTATPAVDLHIQAAGSASAEVRLASATRSYNIGSTGSGYGSANNLIIYDLTGAAERYRLDASGNHFWNNVGGVAGTAMTLNSTGLGVGNAPVAALDVYKVANDTINRTNATFCFGQITGLGAALLGQQSASAPYQFNLQAANAANSVQFPLVLQPSGGNVGIGVVPSAWNSSYRGLQLGAGGAISAHTSASLPWLVATSNSFINSAGDWKFINNGYSTRYLARGDDGTQSWWTSNNGLAGGTVAYTQAMTLDASGNLLVGTTSGTSHNLRKQGTTVEGDTHLNVGNAEHLFFACSSVTYNAAAAAYKITRNSSTLRSINAGGTINASGADYAEYMTKASDFVLSKGGIAGIDTNGKLTNVFADAVSFVVKSTDPSYVGNDKWGNDLEGDELEAARQLVDRIAFAGQVPVNVTGAKAGDYIVPVVDGTGIKGIAVSKPTFDQYQLAVGKVIAIDADGRARIIVKVA